MRGVAVEFRPFCVQETNREPERELETMAGSIHDMSLLVGGLQASVRSLEVTVSELNRMWGIREASASQGRQVIHDKLDDLRDEVTRMTADFENMSRDIMGLESLKTDKAERDGARKAQAKMMAVLASAGGVFGAIATELIRLLWQHK